MMLRVFAVSLMITFVLGCALYAAGKIVDAFAPVLSSCPLEKQPDGTYAPCDHEPNQ